MRNVFGGFYINGKHTYHDYLLFLSAPPDFGVPEPKVQTIDIPGADGVLDYTEAATGEVKYANRQIVLTFVTEIQRERREALRSELWNDLQGQIVELIYDYDSDWYYTGRASVTFQDVQSWKMKCVITIDAQPYKLARTLSSASISASSFSAHTVGLGNGLQGGAATTFTFGSKSNPKLDLTDYSKIRFEWPSFDYITTPELQIFDSNGAVFSTNLNADGVGSTYYKELNVSNISTIDKTNVYKILCVGRKNVKLFGTTTSSATLIVRNDRMRAVPTITASGACNIIVRGDKYALASGQNYNPDIWLESGVNELSIVATASRNVSLTWRKGRL